MNDAEAGQAATPDKSQDTSKPYTERFNAALEGWRKEGCPRSKDDHPCSALPHRCKILPKDADGNFTMSMDCVAGHEDVWQFKISAEEMNNELDKQSAAAKEATDNAGKSITRDPMKATLKITMDLRTQQIDIEPWVPTPGIGIQMAGILLSHFFAQLQGTIKQPAPGAIITPSKKLLDRNGKPIATA